MHFFSILSSDSDKSGAHRIAHISGIIFHPHIKYCRITLELVYRISGAYRVDFEIWEIQVYYTFQIGGFREI